MYMLGLGLSQYEIGICITNVLIMRKVYPFQYNDKGKTKREVRVYANGTHEQY